MLTEENASSLLNKSFISGKPVLICGNAPRLRKDLSEIDFSISTVCTSTVIEADGATAVLRDMGIVPEVICTNLEGNFNAD